MVFDIDRDWPAPGWTLGFGRITRAGGARCILIEGDGTRRPSVETGRWTQTNGETTATERTTDGSFITFTYLENSQGKLVDARARYPDGKVVDYVASDESDALFPQYITDRHGNYIGIYYWGKGPRIHQLSDTCGRLITFHYDTLERLTAITGPSVDGPDVPLVRLHYAQDIPRHHFKLPVEPIGVVHLIDAIFFPGTGRGYDFRDDGRHLNYSPYGMLRRINQTVGMSLDTSGLEEQGVVSQGGTTILLKEYNYPTDIVAELDTPPTYDTLTEFCSRHRGSAVTTFSRVEEVDQLRTVVIRPDGVRTIQTLRRSLASASLLPAELTVLDRAGTPVQQTVMQWEPGHEGVARVAWVQVRDRRGRITATSYGYGEVENQVTDVRFHDFDSDRILKRIHTDFVPADPYQARHLMHLPRRMQVYDQAGTVALEVEYEYDTTPLRPTPRATNHDDTYDPASPRYDPSNALRGNATVVRTYIDASTRAGAIVSTRLFDTCGNLCVSDWSGRREENTFTALTKYSQPSETFTGSPDLNSSARLRIAQLSYNAAGLPSSVTDVNGETVDLTYDRASMRLKQLVSRSRGSSTVFDFDDLQQREKRTVHEVHGASPPIIAAEDTWLYDGRGRVVTHFHDTDENVEVREYEYDHRGQVVAVSAPRWVTEAARWGSLTYDPLGRPLVSQTPGGETITRHYDEETAMLGLSPDGPTVRTMAPSGRDRLLTFDALGQLSSVLDPDPDGSGSILQAGASPVPTSYTYDGNGNVTEIRTGRPAPWPFPYRATQFRRFRYDSLSRLTAQYLPEHGYGLDESGSPLGNPLLWSHIFTYDDRSNLISKKDGRGVTVNFHFDDDPLDRVQKVTYDVPAVVDDAAPVVPCPDVEYTYVKHGDSRRVETEITVGVSRQTIRYDSVTGQTETVATLLDATPSFPSSTGYRYDSLGRIKAVIRPPCYGGTGQSPAGGNKHLKYAVGGLPSDVTVLFPSWPDASHFTYTPDGRIAGMQVGNIPPALPLFETYLYEEDHDGVWRQQLVQDNRLLLDLSYHYFAAGLGGEGISHEQLATTTDHLDASGDRTFRYDVWGRLRTATAGQQPAWTWAQDYEYDIFGNRTSVVASGSIEPGNAITPDGEASLAYDKANHITTDGFGYDKTGNLVSAHVNGHGFSYQYDAASRLTYAKDDATGEVTGFVYGACNRRRATLRLRSGPWPPGDPPSNMANPDRITAATFYAWDYNQVIVTHQDTGPPFGEHLVWKDVYVFLGPRLLSHYENHPAPGEPVVFEHPGPTGTRVVSRRDSSTSHEPLPYGSRLVRDGGASRAFTTYERDMSTGLDYAVNRFYQPSLGRFLQPDPIGAAAFDPVNPASFNTYTYAGNDPVNRTDPIGLDFVSIVRGHRWRPFLWSPRLGEDGSLARNARGRSGGEFADRGRPDRAGREEKPDPDSANRCDYATMDASLGLSFHMAIDRHGQMFLGVGAGLPGASLRLGRMLTVEPPTPQQSASFQTGHGFNLNASAGGASAAYTWVPGNPLGVEAGISTPGWGASYTYGADVVQLLTNLYRLMTDIEAGFAGPGGACR
ncbi:RHS repeat-associated core domain-containing protein [Kribbella sp. NPDC051952]|uniref:RHS repeat-associated core domain-containing protein n=1 Tax=Kribbella sp. NPDC051952 TaxID=3154851 RepID=UPI0034388321